MTNELKQWIAKAEGDYRSALRLSKYNDSASYDAICFHAQQCAEKYLKALLIAYKIEFKKKHDLTYLLNLILPHDSSLELIRIELDSLNDYAIDIRYPGDFATADEAKLSLRHMKVVRKFISEKLGIAKPRAKKKR